MILRSLKPVMSTRYSAASPPPLSFCAAACNTSARARSAPRSALDQEPVGEKPFAGAVDIHNADIEGSAQHLGEGDDVASRRPPRCNAPRHS